MAETCGLDTAGLKLCSTARGWSTSERIVTRKKRMTAVAPRTCAALWGCKAWSCAVRATDCSALL